MAKKKDFIEGTSVKIGTSDKIIRAIGYVSRIVAMSLCEPRS